VAARPAASAAATAVSAPPQKFTTVCTHCRQTFAAPESLKGQLTRCPGCGQSFKALPAGKQAAMRAAQPVAAPKPAAPQSPDWKWFEDNFEPYKPPKVEKEKPRRPQIKLPQTLADDDKAPLRLANRSTRLVAAIIDNVFALGIPAFLFFVSVMSLFQRSQQGEELTQQELSDLRLGLIIVGGSFLALGLVNLILLAARGQTIGKAIMGIKIVGSDGYPCFGRIFFIRMLGMNVLCSIPFVGGVIAIMDILMIFRESRQCLHDQLADTVVVRAR
jgi:uncharacterized RDD family membrane protein YckC